MKGNEPFIALCVETGQENPRKGSRMSTAQQDDRKDLRNRISLLLLRANGRRQVRTKEESARLNAEFAESEEFAEVGQFTEVEQRMLDSLADWLRAHPRHAGHALREAAS